MFRHALSLGSEPSFVNLFIMSDIYTGDLGPHCLHYSILSESRAESRMCSP